MVPLRAAHSVWIKTTACLVFFSWTAEHRESARAKKKDKFTRTAALKSFRSIWESFLWWGWTNRAVDTSHGQRGHWYRCCYVMNFPKRWLSQLGYTEMLRGLIIFQIVHASYLQAVLNSFICGSSETVYVLGLTSWQRQPGFVWNRVSEFRIPHDFKSQEPKNITQ